MMSDLLCIERREQENGGLPSIPPNAYVGFFDAGDRRLVYIQSVAGLAHIYLSRNWAHPYVLRDGLLPREIVLSSPEAAWAMACWRAARASFR
jgi:hypothetical protein